MTVKELARAMGGIIGEYGDSEVMVYSDEEGNSLHSIFIARLEKLSEDGKVFFAIMPNSSKNHLEDV